MKGVKVTILLSFALFIFIHCKAVAQPVLYLNFEKVEDGVVYDQSGNGNNGIIDGEIIQSDDGVVDKALEFDSTLIKFARGNIFNIDNALTFSFWAKNMDQPRTDYRTIFALLTTEDTSIIRIAWGYNEKHLFISRNNDSLAHNFYVSYTSGYGHYCIVFKDTIVWVYKDDELSEEWDSNIDLALTQDDTTIQVLIGALDENFHRPMKGILDEFKIFNRALDSVEVNNLYHSATFSDYSNLIINSSFEQTTLPDFPDHWCSKGGFYPDINYYSLTLDNEMAHNSDGHKSMRFDFNNNTTPILHYI